MGAEDSAAGVSELMISLVRPFLHHEDNPRRALFSMRRQRHKRQTSQVVTTTPTQETTTTDTTDHPDDIMVHMIERGRKGPANSKARPPPTSSAERSSSIGMKGGGVSYGCTRRGEGAASGRCRSGTGYLGQHVLPFLIHTVLG